LFGLGAACRLVDKPESLEKLQQDDKKNVILLMGFTSLQSTINNQQSKIDDHKNQIASLMQEWETNFGLSASMALCIVRLKIAQINACKGSYNPLRQL
jgi:uncharacterized phage infection (PIP) family protein YhgE